MLLWHPEVLESDVKISDNKNPSRCYIWEKNPSRRPDRDYRFRVPFSITENKIEFVCGHPLQHFKILKKFTSK